MSAGYNEPHASHDLSQLAPKFRVAVEAALLECTTLGIDAFVFEGYRSNELAQLYYARGRTVIPPHEKVTNAPNNTFSWHGYGLAVDVISRTKEWDVASSWFKDMADVFKRHGCNWGGDWRMRDLPHIQWGKCKPSPSEVARSLINAPDGLAKIWKLVDAD